MIKFAAAALVALSIVAPFESAYAAAPKGSVAVDPANMFTVTSGGTTYNCAFINGKYVSGKKLSSSLFITFSQLSKNEKKKGKTAKAKSFTAKSKAGNAACSSGPPGGGGGTTPDPNANFDSAGNVTEVGKIRFGIPAALSANVARGVTARNNNCTGCHNDRTNWTFPALRERIKLEPMYYDETIIPDQTLADLVAYLNRFQLP